MGDNLIISQGCCAGKLGNKKTKLFEENRRIISNSQCMYTSLGKCEDAMDETGDSLKRQER
jgi:hypothetical protein